ncbi:methionyl-tRNA formyltransferase ['Osedax' symbiont bacterium Rs2_46_30_T18]|nr:methionyl-tRNA formyltransferase ['Osedax' symbiont bacterium Rs2_46_30_T18]
MSKSLKIVFAGTPEFAAQSLIALIDSHHQLVATYTQPDRRAGRGKKINQSAVKKVSLAHDIPVYQPDNFKDPDSVKQLSELDADIMVVVAYGILLPQAVLDTPRLGCINVHASLLPKWRGAAPIERALLAGDLSTGVTIMQMDKGLDTGDMLNKQTIDITATMTSGQLHDALIPIGCNSLLKTLQQLADGTSTATRQDDQLACYASKLFKSEGQIDWNQDASQISLLIRGLSPRPVAHSNIGTTVIRLWNAVASNSETDPLFDSALVGTICRTDKSGIEVLCKGGTKLLIKSLQVPGGKQLSARDLINSKRELFSPGSCFTTPCIDETK